MTNQKIITEVWVFPLATFLAIGLVRQEPVRGDETGEAIRIAEVRRDGPVSFEKEILPILRQKCLACHNKAEAESDLVLETPQSILEGGAEGPAVVAGKSEESLLLKAASKQSEPLMPPEDNDVGAKPLTPEELGLIKLWIDQGAQGQVAGTSGPIQWQPLPPGVNPIYAVAVSPDGQYVAAGRANQVFLYHLPTKREIGRLTDPSLMNGSLYGRPGVAHLDLVQSLRFSPDSELLASGGYRTVKFWRRARNARKLELAGLDGSPRAVALSPDGKWIAFGEVGGTIKLFDLTSGKITYTFSGHNAAITGLCFLKDGSELVSGSLDGTLRLWNVAEARQTGSVETAVPINAIALVGEDRQVATAGQDHVIRIWPLPKSVQEGAQPEEKQDAAQPATDKPAEPPKPVQELKGHGGPVTSLASVPPNGAQLLSGSHDSTVRQWDANSGKQIRQMNHGGPVESVAVGPDGGRFASASANGTAKIWDASKGNQIAELKGDFRARIRVEDVTKALAVARRHVDGNKADLKAANDRKASEDKNTNEAEEARKKAEAEFKKNEEAAKKPIADKEAADKAFAEAQAARKKAEEAKTAADTSLAKADEALKNAQAELAKSTENEKAAQQQSDTEQRAAEAAKIAAEKAVADAQAAKKAAEEAKKTADEALAKADGDVKQADANLKKLAGPAQKAVDERNSAQRELQSAQRTAQRSREAAREAAEAIPAVEATVSQAEQRVKETEQLLETVRKEATESEKPCRAVAFSPDGLFLATGGDDQTVRTWDAGSGAAVETFAGHQAAIAALAYTAGGDVISAANNTAFVWDTNPQWRLVKVIGSVDSPEHLADRVLALDFSPDGKLLATGGGEPSRSGELKIWKVEDGSLVREIKDAHSDTIFGLEFSPDGKQIASCAADRFAKVFEVQSGNLVRALEGHTHHVMGVSWRADGRLLATGGADGVVKVWNARSGDQTRTISGFGKEVTSIRFVAAGDNVLVSCGDRSIQLKNADNGGNVRGFGGAADFMYAAGATADGKIIAAGGQDSVLRLWLEGGQAYANFEAPKPQAN